MVSPRHKRGQLQRLFYLSTYSTLTSRVRDCDRRCATGRRTVADLPVRVVSPADSAAAGKPNGAAVECARGEKTRVMGHRQSWGPMEASPFAIALRCATSPIFRYAIGSTHCARHAGAVNGSAKYCVSWDTLSPLNSMMLTV